MTKQDFVKHLLETPHNINPVIVYQLLDELMNTKTVSSQEELEAALVEGGDIALNCDIETDKPCIISKDTKLELNGNKIVAKKDYADWYMLKAENAKLTICGQGLISAGESVNAIPVTAASNSVVEILDGEFACRKDQQCVYANGGLVNIYGGTYGVVEGDEVKDLLNVQNTRNVEDIRVYGGTFVGRDPSLGDDALNGNFVAEGYRSVEVEKGVFKVMK